jgi:hypothetical protein
MERPRARGVAKAPAASRIVVQPSLFDDLINEWLAGNDEVRRAVAAELGGLTPVVADG